MNKRFLLLLLAISAISKIGAQINFENLTEEQIYRKGNKYNVWSITAGYGPVIYYVDVVDYTFFPKEEWRFGPSLNVARQFGRSWAIDANFMMANMYGQKYSRYFEGDFLDFSINGTAYLNQLIIGGPMRDKWNLYFKFGFGVNFFRSMQKWQDGVSKPWEAHDPIWCGIIFFDVPSGYIHNYSDWNYDDYLVMGYNRQTLKKEKRQAELVLPIGVGVKYRVNKSFDLGFDISYRSLRADNLDVDMTGADNDAYMYTSLNLTYKIGKKDKRHASWTYKDFNIDYSKKRGKDPMTEKLDSLYQQLAHLAANNMVINDTILIPGRTDIKPALNVSVFFDFDKSTITEASHRAIINIANYMTSNPDVKVGIRGFCDERGNVEYNIKLSERRCAAVKDVLVNEYGISPERLTIHPYGKSNLLSDTSRKPSRGEHLVNRRVDVFTEEN